MVRFFSKEKNSSGVPFGGGFFVFFLDPLPIVILVILPSPKPSSFQIFLTEDSDRSNCFATLLAEAHPPPASTAAHTSILFSSGTAFRGCVYGSERSKRPVSSNLFIAALIVFFDGLGRSGCSRLKCLLIFSGLSPW